MHHPKAFLASFLLLVLTFSVSGQTWKDDLAKGDLDAAALKLTASGTSFKKEPVLAVYLLAAGKNGKFTVVKDLVDRGADPSLGLKNPGTGAVDKPLNICLVPAYGVVLSPDQADIVRLLLDKGALADLVSLRVTGQTVLDYVLGQLDGSPAGLRAARAAAILLNDNLRVSPRRRLAVDPRFATQAAVLADDIDQVRKLIQSGANAPELLNLAVAAGSEKTTDYLFQMFGYRQDVTAVLAYVPYNPKILGAFLDHGLGLSDLYRYACLEGKPEVVRQVRARDDRYLWVGFVPGALAAGADCFNALTNGSQDFADPAALKAVTITYNQNNRTAYDVLGDMFYGKSFSIKDIHDKVGPETVALILKNLPPTGADQVARVLKFSAKAITGLQFAPGSGKFTVVINETSHTVEVTAPGGTNPGKLNPRVVFAGASVLPVPGTTLDFTKPVVYTVTADDGSTQGYLVTVKVPKTDKALTAFKFDLPGAVGTVDEPGHTVAVTVPAGTDPAALVPIFTFTGVAVSPGPGTAQNFTGPVVYTVTAEDGSAQRYVVTVTVTPAPTPVPVPTETPLPTDQDGDKSVQKG